MAPNLAVTAGWVALEGSAFLAGMGEGNESRAEALGTAWGPRFPEICPCTKLGALRDQKPPTHPRPRLVPRQKRPNGLPPLGEQPEPTCR